MIKKKSLVLGSTGQDGALLSLSLLKQNYVVIGTSRKIQTHGLPEIANHAILGIEKDIKLENCDPEDFKQVKDIIEKYKPNEIYNLAAQSSVGKSYNYPQKTLKSIVDVTLNILEVCRHIKYDGRIFFAGSSEIFGNTESGAKISDPHKPVNPYGIAKQASYNLVKMYRNLYNLKCVTGILFNHESHMRSEDFVTQKIITGAINCSRNKSHKIRLGNLKISRDWGWAEEYVEGIQLMNRSLNIKDQILCTGKLTKLEEFVQIAFEQLNLNWKDHVLLDKEFLRKSEIYTSYGDPTRMKDDLKWEAELNIHEIIEKLINYKINS
mgnify:FL=1